MNSHTQHCILLGAALFVSLIGGWRDMAFAEDWKSQRSEVETSWPRRVAGGCSHKVVIVLVAWIHLPEDLLECVLQKLMRKDRHAPRVATVHSSWSFAIDKCLISYCDGDHL